MRCARAEVVSSLPEAHILSQRSMTAARLITGPSTVGWVGWRSLAAVTWVEAGMIMGRISEMNGISDAMAEGVLLE